MTDDTTQSFTFQCKCGAIQANLRGPPVRNVNCHCHSCVAAAKFIESKPKFCGSSMFDAGGVAYADFRWPNIQFLSPQILSNESRDKIGFVKVGPNGNFARSYLLYKVRDHVGIFMEQKALLNRHAIFNKDGSRYQSSFPVCNIMLWYAFENNDPSPLKYVPEPRYNFVPFGMAISFIPLVLGFGKEMGIQQSALFPKDLSSVDEVTITWQ